MEYRADINGLRAVAVLPVLFFHAGFSYFQGGFVGVDVFFVISGYLIASIILHDQKLERFSLWDFYLRRVRRIAPMVFIVCVATIPFAWAWMLPSEFHAYSKSLYTTAVSLSNFHFWDSSDYFAESTAFRPLLHTWSLAIEFQFYLIFPLLLLFFRQKSAVAISVIASASFLLTFFFSRIDPDANFYLLPTRFWELSVGALVALFHVRLSGRGAELASLAGLLLIVASFFLIDGSHVYPSPWTLLPVLGTVALLASDGRTAAGRMLGVPPLVAIGLVSYSVYLWHQPIFAFTRIRFGEDLSALSYLGLIGLTLVLSYFSWKWVENFFRRAKATRKAVITATLACFIPIILLAGLGDATDGLSAIRARTAEAAAIDDRTRVNHGLAPACNGQLPISKRCYTNDEPEIVVWGDSYAMHLVPGIIASNPDVRLVQFTQSSCSPILGIVATSSETTTKATRCLNFNNKAREFISASKTIRYAVLSSPFSSFSDKPGPVLTSDGVVTGDLAMARRHLEDTIAWLQSLNIQPVVFMPPPRDGSEVGTCVARSIWWGSGKSECDMKMADVTTYLRPAVSLLSTIDVPKIDLADVMCDAEICKAQFGDISIFRDDGHLSYEGSAYLGSKMSFYDLITGQSRVATGHPRVL
jgi:peptidoglycan/LPS O-acetylase OafA/YrhL